MQIHYHREQLQYRQYREPIRYRELIKEKGENNWKYLHDPENLIQLILYMQFEQHDEEIYKMESKL
jgi:hypothetical protein